jgi:3-keto-5-aminohexanoate cleavage enzyme
MKYLIDEVLMRKMIITVAPTGPLTSKKDNPNVAISPEEISNTIYESYKAGAAVAHIHARNKEGKPTADLSVFREIIDRIEEKCDINIQISTGVGLDVAVGERIKLVNLNPKMMTLNLGSMNFGNGVFLNPPDMIERLAKMMIERNIKPELEVYDMGHIRIALELLERGFLKEPLQFSFVMGVRGGIISSPKNLINMLEAVPEGSIWQVISIGRHQLLMSIMGMGMGGNVRVGMEDNVFFHKAELAKNDTQFVERIIRIARELKKDIATSEEARNILNI